MILYGPVALPETRFDSQEIPFARPGHPVADNSSMQRAILTSRTVLVGEDAVEYATFTNSDKLSFRQKSNQLG